MRETKRNRRKELARLHRTWKQGKKTLKWWKNETGYIGINIRKFCDIPIPHPDSAIQIACLYLLHLEYISQRTYEPAIFTFKVQVVEFLEKEVKRSSAAIRKSSLFPW
jgi:hypothetical protein